MLIKKILYYLVKSLAELLSYSFFKEIKVIGLQNIPKDKPVILCGTHNNQFVDGMMLIITAKRPINFLVAEKSTKQLILGNLLKMMHIVPVTRAIDRKKSGSGLIQTIDIDSLIVRGTDTKFCTEIKVLDSVRIIGVNQEINLPEVFNFVVEKIIDDKTIQIKFNPEEIENVKKSDIFVNISETLIQFDSKFLILPKINQKDVFKETIDTLKENKIIGIFPEGGSHDQTKLLEIKPGACIFAYKFYERTRRNCLVIPVGINYFGSHRFRSKVIVNIGKPLDFELKAIKEEQFKGKILR